MHEKSKVSVILPTYNEKGNIVKLINEISKHIENIDHEKEIVVVDDNSPDGTGETVRTTFAQDPSVRLIVRTEEKGFATAIRHGIENSTGDYIIVMDTDFNHDPKMIPQMVKYLEHYDIISGSRFTMGGSMRPVYRYLCSYFYNLFIRLILRTQIQDNLCGYFSIRREKLFTLPFDNIFFGFGEYYFRMLYYAQINHCRVLEVPVIYLEREYGESKVNPFYVFKEYTIALMLFFIRKGAFK